MMWSPEKVSQIPMGKDLRCKLNYGEDTRPNGECFVFIEDVRGFRRTFRNSKGVSGQEFHDWKSPEHQRGLDEMTDAYLEQHGRGPMFWPSDPILPYYSDSLQYSEHRSLLLFFRLNLSYYRNSKYKDSRSKSSNSTGNVVLDSQEDHRSEVASTNEEDRMSGSVHLNQPVLSNSTRVPSSVCSDNSFDPDIELLNQRRNIAQSISVAASSCNSLIEALEDAQDVPPEEQIDKVLKRMRMDISGKRPAADDSSAREGTKRTRSSYAPASTNKSTVCARSRPQRKSTKNAQPQNATPMDCASSAKPCSPIAVDQSWPNDVEADRSIPEPSSGTPTSAPRLIVRLKAPRTLLMGLESRLNRPQDTEEELGSVASPPIPLDLPSSAQVSGADATQSEHRESETEIPGASKTQAYEIQSSSPMAMRCNSRSPSRAPFAKMVPDQEQLDSIDATVAAPQPPQTALNPIPSHPPPPTAKPTFAVVCRIIISRDDPQLNQVWEPKGGFRSLSLKQLTEHLPYEEFMGIRFQLRRDLFRTTHVVYAAKDDQQEFEVMKKKFGAAISKVMSQAKAGSRVDFELEIEPIATEVDQEEQEESWVGQGW